MRAADGPPLEEPTPLQHRVLLPDADHPTHEAQEVPLLRAQGPVQPGKLVVLAIGVVVPALAVAQLVAAAEHGNALRQQHRGQQVALLPLAQRQHMGVAGRPLHPAVPAQIVVGAVAVVLAVGLVVFVVVADQVFQGEAVVAGHEVDAGVGAPPALLVQVAGARQPGGQLRGGVPVALPVAANGVPVAAVPFGPQHGEVAHLVSARAHVPGLGDELDLRQHRILVNDVEEGPQLVHVVQLAGQGAGQIEAEAVDVHLQHPVAQAVHDQLQHPRVAHVQRVAAAGEVHVVAGILGRQPVVAGVVHPAHGQRGPQVIALGGVVVDHVQDHLDAGAVKVPHHGLELRHRGDRAAGGVTFIGREEAERAVAPVVGQPLIDQVAIVDVVVHRHQLDRGHAQRGEVIDDRLRG